MPDIILLGNVTDGITCTGRIKVEYEGEPCPWRIVDNCCGAFTPGAIGGGIFQAFKGFCSSPVGINHRLQGNFTDIKTRAL